MEDLPLLKGRSIFLRGLVPEDVDSLAHHANDEEISLFITHMSFPYTTVHAQSWIEKTKRLFEDGSQHHFGICDSKSNQVIGVVGLKNINRNDRNSELEYWIGREHRNRGKTAEAIRLILGYAFNALGLHRVYAVVHERNAASIKVLEKCGFTHEGTWRQAAHWDGNWGDVYAYGILEAEYKPPK